MKEFGWLAADTVLVLLSVGCVLGWTMLARERREHAQTLMALYEVAPERIDFDMHGKMVLKEEECEK